MSGIEIQFAVGYTWYKMFTPQNKTELIILGTVVPTSRGTSLFVQSLHQGEWNDRTNRPVPTQANSKPLQVWNYWHDALVLCYMIVQPFHLHYWLNKKGVCQLYWFRGGKNTSWDFKWNSMFSKSTKIKCTKIFGLTL